MNLAWRAAVLFLAVPAARVPPATPGAQARSVLERHEFHEPYMGTVCRIVLYSADASAAAAASRQAFRRIGELDRRFSDYRSDSELSRVVRDAASEPVTVSPDLFAILSTAQTLASRTGGAFDVTAGAITKLWRRARRIGELPSEADVTAARASSGYELLSLEAANRTVQFRQNGVQLDLGGIAKGYAADAALAEIRSSGFPRALVAVGGDIATGDAPPRAAGWEVGISEWGAGADAPALVVLSRSAISTSGDSEQWLEVDGVRYSHIVDPRTGRALTERRQVSVIAPRATTSDMLATSASVLGGAEAIRLVEETPGAAILTGTREKSGLVRWTASSRWPWPQPSGPETRRGLHNVRGGRASALREQP